MRNVIIWHWLIKNLMGTRRRNDVDATSLRRIDVVSTSCACWEFGPPTLAPPKILNLAPPPNILNLPTPMICKVYPYTFSVWRLNTSSSLDLWGCWCSGPYPFSSVQQTSRLFLLPSGLLSYFLCMVLESGRADINRPASRTATTGRRHVLIIMVMFISIISLLMWGRGWGRRGCTGTDNVCSCVRPSVCPYHWMEIKF